jgi:hypothetical protein
MSKVFEPGCELPLTSSKCRAILVRYDKKATNYLALIKLAFLLN